MSNNRREIRELIEKYVEGKMSESEVAHLEQLLMTDKQARRDYLNATQFESSMHFYADSSAEAESQSANLESDSSPSAFFGFPQNPASWMTLIGIALLLSVAAFLLFRDLDQNGDLDQVLYVVSCDGTQRNWNVGDELTGPIDVSEGVLTLTTRGGGLISLEGPCAFEMNSLNVGTLKDGKVIVFCGEQSEKITIRTSSGTYADLGTEFGVSVDKEESSLHVFDGQVFATRANGLDAQVVEGASAIQSGQAWVTVGKTLVDFARFDRLRCSLSDGIVVESFEESEMSLSRETPFELWKLNSFLMEESIEGSIEDTTPLAHGLEKHLTIEGNTDPAKRDGELAFVEAQWDYSKGQPIDVAKAHTIECVVRFNCEPDQIHDFSIYGSGESTWKDRSWSVGANQTNGQLMWNVFNSPKAVGANKFQYLSIERFTTFHVLVEIDPVIGKYRTTVSDGQQRIWNELYDGSPVSLKPAPLGKLFWRARGKAGKELSFSIDSIQVRNRPVLGEPMQTANSPLK